MNDPSGVPASEAAVLYRGEVMHARLKPVGHRFVYHVLNLLIDLDRLEEADRLSVLFGINRAALFSFQERDHGPRDGSPLARHVRTIALAQGIDLTGGRILLLCYPRLLGYAFNPLSIYYGYRADGSLALVIYEVRNTFGENHSYICPVAPGQDTGSELRQTQDKRFYVSPFIGMEMRYHFRLSPPAGRLKVRILETDRAGPLLAATFKGCRWALTTPHLLVAFFRLPLVTLKVMGGIHFEAARLWFKGLRLQPRSNDTPSPGGKTDTVTVPDLSG